MTPIAFSGNPLDRASVQRADPAWLAAQKPAGLFLPCWQNRPLVRADRAVFLGWRGAASHSLPFGPLQAEQFQLIGDPHPTHLACRRRFGCDELPIRCGSAFFTMHRLASR